MEKDRLERFGEAVEEKKEEPDPRAKNSGHGKNTADKWNQ